MEDCHCRVYEPLPPDGLLLKLMEAGTEPGQIVVAPEDVIVPATNSVAFTKIVAVLVQLFDVPVTVNVVETSGFTLAIPLALAGTGSTYCAGDQAYVVAPDATNEVVSPIAIFNIEPETCV
jgi:hypothetical protein